MIRRYLTFIILMVVAVPLLSASQNNKVVIMKIEGPITEGVAEYMASTIHYAHNNNASGILIVLNTDGGFLKPTERIVTEISSSPIPVAVFVPPGGRAFSAGTFILMASDKVCMGPGSSIGAAEPRPKDEKISNALASWLKSLARSSGRNETAAELFVKENLALAADEALRYEVVDCVAKDIKSFLDEIGWPTNVEEYMPDLRISILLLITDPINTWVLFLAGVVLVLLGLAHPTYVLEGVGAILVILSLYALGLMEANLASILLMLLGAATIFLELKTGHGFLALAGAIIASVGLFLLYESSPLISLGVSAEVIVIAVIILAGLAGFYLYKIREALLRKPSLLSPDQLIGREGIVRVSINPPKEGVVLIGSELWTAYADEPLNEGDRVKVVSVKGFKVKVVKV